MNNSFKSFSKSYYIEIVKAVSFSDVVKTHLVGGSSELSQEGYNYFFPISIVSDKIGEISTMILIYFKVRRKDGVGKNFERIVPLEIKANVFIYLFI